MRAGRPFATRMPLLSAARRSQPLSADIVGEWRVKDHGNLDEAENGAVCRFPGCLVNELVLPLLLDGVGVGASGGEQVGDDGAGMLRMAVHEVAAYQVAVLDIRLAGAFVLVDDGTVGVADGDGTGHAICPVGHVNGKGFH